MKLHVQAAPGTAAAAPGPRPRSALEGVVIWGAAGHALVLREAIRELGIPVVALFDNRPVASPIPELPVRVGDDGFERWLAGEMPARFGFLVAIGGERGRDRLAIQRRLSARGLVALTVVHRTAFVAVDAAVGTGSHVLANAAVCAAARLGDGVIVNTAASVDHECTLGDGVHVGPGAHLAGCVTVEPFAMVGTGAAVAPRVRIGEGAVVGAGAVVIRDVAPAAVVAGNPARVIGSRVTP